MRIAILSDIHANSDALAAVLADIARHDVAATVHLGDVVGYNTRPRETLALLREHRIPGVRGNHDLMAIGRLPADQCGPVGRKAIGWTRKVLTEADCDYLASLPDELRLEGGILCTHSALGDPCVRLHARGQFEEETEVLLHFDGDLRVCCTGHTHLQQVVEVAAGGVVRRPAVPELVLDPAAFCFLNPGSVGQPRDGDERAAYAVFDSETYHVWFHRVAYDVRRITRENARRGIRIGPRAAQGQSLMSRLFSSVP